MAILAYPLARVGTLAFMAQWILKGPAKPEVVYEIIVKRDNGEMVAVTQPASVNFNRGDRVKILQREGEARVIH